LKLKFIVLGFIFTVSTLYAVQYRCFEEEEYEYSLSTNFGEQVPNDANAFASNLPISDEDDFGEREEEGATTTTSGGEEDEDEDDEKEPIRRSSSSSNDESVNYNLPGADASMPCGGQPREMLPFERERRLRRKMLGDAGEDDDEIESRNISEDHIYRNASSSMRDSGSSDSHSSSSSSSSRTGRRRNLLHRRHRFHHG
jgi:hypothetical protein